jgi:hypothetical protein
MSKHQSAKAGSLLCIDSGVYSDYGVIGFFVVLQDFVPMAELESYLKKNPKQKEPCSFDRELFLTHLLQQGYLLEISYSTLHLGDYSEAHEVEFYSPTTEGKE